MGNQALFAKNPDVIDPKASQEENWSDFWFTDEGFWLRPEDFVLVSTVEKITLSDGYAARVEGKSSLGRLGLLTHITAGFVDPGFSGNITLELKNVNRSPIHLYPGMKIAQLCFIRLDSKAQVPYGSKSVGSHYHGQSGPQVSRINESFYQMGVTDV